MNKSPNVKSGRRPFILIGLTLLFIVIICGGPIAWLYEDEINSGITSWLRSFDLPKAERDFNQLYQDLSIPSEDVLLSEEISLPETNISRFQADCIFGGITRFVGTNRPYDRILQDFKAYFASLTWQRTDTVIGYDGIPRGVFESEIASIHVDYVDFENNEYENFIDWEQIEWEPYETVYYFNVLFADPSLAKCQGG